MKYADLVSGIAENLGVPKILIVNQGPALIISSGTGDCLIVFGRTPTTPSSSGGNIKGMVDSVEAKIRG